MNEKKYEVIPSNFWVIVFALMAISVFINPWLGFGLAFIVLLVDKYRPR